MFHWFMLKSFETIKDTDILKPTIPIQYSGTATRGVLQIMVFLDIQQNSHENTNGGDSEIEIAGLKRL